MGGELRTWPVLAAFRSRGKNSSRIRKNKMLQLVKIQDVVSTEGESMPKLEIVSRHVREKNCSTHVGPFEKL